MPRRRASGAASSTSEGSGSSTDSSVPLPPPGIDMGVARQSGATPKGAGKQEPTATVANGKREDEVEKQPQPALFRKTKMCKFHQLGMCTRGEACCFAHGKTDMTALPDLSRTKLCKELVNTGQCSDPSCKFAHTRHELRRHPFAPAGDKNHSGPGIRQPRRAAAPDAAPGPKSAQLQADANLLCSDLATVLYKMKQSGLAGSPALYGDLAHALKDFHDSDLVDAWMQQSQAPGGYVGPQFDGTAGAFGENSTAFAYAQSHRDPRGAAYVGPSGYHGAGVAEMEQLATSAVWGYGAPFHARAAPPGRAAAQREMASSSLDFLPEPKLLSPMYAPMMSSSIDVLPPFALA